MFTGSQGFVKKRDLEMAKIRFLNAFRAIFSQQTVSDSKDEQHLSTSREKHYVPASKEEQSISTSKEEQNVLASKEEQNVPALKEEENVSTSTEEQHVPAFKEEQNISTSKEEQNVSASSDEKNLMASKEEHDDNPLDILVLHSCGEVGCRYLNFAMSTLESFVQLKCAFNDNDCLPSRRRIKYLIEAMCKSNCIIIILHEASNFAVTKNEFIDRALEIALVKHRTKTLQIRKEGVEQDETVCKEVILSCDFDENVNPENSLILKGDLFSDVLKAMSEM